MNLRAREGNPSGVGVLSITMVEAVEYRDG